MSTNPQQRGTGYFGVGLICLALVCWLPGCSKMIRSSSAGAKSPAPVITIREFPDVPIPRELKLDQKDSFVYTTPGFATGLLVYGGNVDYDSLVRFFEVSLPKHGWLRRASLKYPRTMLFYQKENRLCLIAMKTRPFGIRVEIWVAPVETLSLENASSGR